MKKKFLLLITLTIMFVSTNVYADTISIVKGSGQSCSNGTCFKLGKDSNGNYKVLYCTEPNKDWTSAIKTYEMVCTKQEPTDKMLQVAYMFEKGYSEYSDTGFSNEKILLKSYQNNKKTYYDNTQKSIWKILYPNEYSATDLSNSAQDITLDGVKKALIISEKSTSRTDYFISQYNVKANSIYLHEDTLYVELTNVPEEIHNKIFISTSSTATYNDENKFSCDSNTNICTKKINLTSSSKGKNGQNYYIMASSKGINSELNFSVKMSVKTYYNPEESTISKCYKDMYVGNTKLQRVVKYDRNIYTISKTSSIKWKQSCAPNCSCGQTENENGIECCTYEPCPVNKCPEGDNNEKTINCNDGVTETSTCKTLNINDNVISITETKTISNALSTNQVIAGGRIEFNLIYNNIITWECNELSNCVTSDDIASVVSLASEDTILSDSTINGTSINTNKECYRTSGNNQIETTCIIKYEKKVETEEKGTITMSAELNNLNVITDSWANKWSKVKVENAVSDNSCEVIIKQGKYNNYRYRPIDLNNPFPKNVIGLNWLDWVENNTKNNQNYAFTDTISKINNDNYDYKIELTQGLDEEIEEYNKNNSETSYDSNAFFDTFEDYIDINEGDSE